MSNGDLNWIANFIWGIADDVLLDLYVRGKYRDVILRMTVLRRLDAVLEPTKQAVLDMKASLDKAKVVHQDPALNSNIFSIRLGMRFLYCFASAVSCSAYRRSVQATLERDSLEKASLEFLSSTC